MVGGIDNDRVPGQSVAVQALHQALHLEIDRFDVRVIARQVSAHGAFTSADGTDHRLDRVWPQLQAPRRVLAHQFGRGVAEWRMGRIPGQHEHPGALAVALDESDRVVGHERRVVAFGNLLASRIGIVGVRAVEMRVRVVPSPPLHKPMARLACRLEGVCCGPARIEMPLSDVARVVASIPERLAETVVGSA